MKAANASITGLKNGQNNVNIRIGIGSQKLKRDDRQVEISKNGATNDMFYGLRGQASVNEGAL